MAQMKPALTWLGHGTFLFTTPQGRRILVDPWVMGNPACPPDRKAIGKLDLILVATVTGDFIGFPSTACLLQDRLGATNAAAMDILAGCTGFIYGLETARAFIESGAAKNVLVVGAEMLSRITDWTDRNTCVLFGDGAGAALVSADSSKDGRGILHLRLTQFLVADGSLI